MSTPSSFQDILRTCKTILNNNHNQGLSWVKERIMCIFYVPVVPNFSTYHYQRDTDSTYWERKNACHQRRVCNQHDKESLSTLYGGHGKTLTMPRGNKLFVECELYRSKYENNNSKRTQITCRKLRRMKRTRWSKRRSFGKNVFCTSIWKHTFFYFNQTKYILL